MSKDDFDDAEKPAAKPGHNNGIDPAYLKKIIQEVEACDTEIEGMKEDRKAFLESAKENGYSPKMIQKIVALRKRPKEEVQAEQELLEQYDHASGSGIFD